jgi:hypothetical protein
MSEIKMQLVSRKDSTEKEVVEVPTPIGHLKINSKQVPEIKEWMINTDYDIMIKVRMDGARIPSNWEIQNKNDDIEEGDIIADFSIISAEAIKEKKK